MSPVRCFSTHSTTGRHRPKKGGGFEYVLVLIQLLEGIDSGNHLTKGYFRNCYSHKKSALSHVKEGV